MSLYSTIVYAQPKLDTRTDIYWKLCSIFKYSKFCLPYIWGAYTYPLLSTYPGAVLPLAPIPPFPLVVNPTTPSLSYTIPTVFTTNSPVSPPPRPPPQQILPGAPSIPNQPSGPCPPTISICPPGALSGPIDPRQGIFHSIISSVFNQDICQY